MYENNMEDVYADVRVLGCKVLKISFNLQYMWNMLENMIAVTLAKSNYLEFLGLGISKKSQ